MLEKKALHHGVWRNQYAVSGTATRNEHLILKQIASYLKFNQICLLVVLLLSSTVLQVRAELVDRIVAVVNNEAITLIELNNALKPYLDQIDEAGYPSEKRNQMVFQLRHDMLNRMVERKITDQEVARLNLAVSEKEIDNAIDQLKQAQMMTQEDLEAALAKDGITFADYREKVRQEIVRPKLINLSVKSKVVVTESDIKAYYEDHPEFFAGERQYYLRNILFSLDNAFTEGEKAKVRDKAETVMKRLNEGDAFSDLARQFSQAPNAIDGGDLGLFELDALSETIREAVQDLNEGAFSGVILTELGYQIFYVEHIEETDAIPLETVSDQISKKLYDEVVEKQFRDWLDALKEKSHIKIML